MAKTTGSLSRLRLAEQGACRGRLHRRSACLLLGETVVLWARLDLGAAGARVPADRFGADPRRNRRMASTGIPDLAELGRDLLSGPGRDRRGQADHAGQAGARSDAIHVLGAGI